VADLPARVEQIRETLLEDEIKGVYNALRVHRGLLRMDECLLFELLAELALQLWGLVVTSLLALVRH